MRTRDELKEMLAFIDPASCSYAEWVAVGMALKEEGAPVGLWDDWSQRDAARYHAGECERKWDSFRGEAGAKVTGGTLFEMATRGGYRYYDSGGALDWDSIINDEAEPGVVVDRNWVEGREIAEPGDDWNPVKEITSYLSALFESTEYVGYVTESYQDAESGRYLPRKGNFKRTAGELIEALKGCGGDIGAVLGDYNQECGAWIRFNPLDGKGVRNANVTDYRFALVESDTMGIPTQYEIICRLELPVVMLVHSGKKSLHAIVRIDAGNYDEYRKRVDYLYSICEKNGLSIDKQNRNPSRLSRMPGVIRAGHKQFIVASNIGKRDFVTWQEWLDAESDDLPDTENMADVWDNLPPLSPPLIDGVLRQGHKMLIAGPSKAGKSFALIELAISIAEGRAWFGWPCQQGRVMYVNLELDPASCLHRIRDVYEAQKLAPSNIKNIDVWNLRGRSVPMDRLAPKLIRRARSKGYIAVIIDPIYKIITGDENSADQMARFCNQFDKVCTELGCAVIYCHHHSKGEQSGKKAMDRASGSGVFARDPDALLDFLQIEVEPDMLALERNKAVAAVVREMLQKTTPKGVEGLGENDARGMLERLASWMPSNEYEQFIADTVEPIRERINRRTGWVIDGTLREFPTFTPRGAWFDYPIHTLDHDGILLKGRGGASNLGRKKSAEDREHDRKESIESAFDAVASFNDGKVTLKDLSEYLGKSIRTVRNYLNENGSFQTSSKGVVSRRDNE